MSRLELFPQDAPPGARFCENCDGRGRIVIRWSDGDVRESFSCRHCDGGGRVLCLNWKGAHRSGCTGFAEHFYDEGEDDLCDHCWSSCPKCGEKLIFIPTEPDSPFCTVCESDALRNVRTADLLTAARR